jgi:hypothetical protein
MDESLLDKVLAAVLELDPASSLDLVVAEAGALESFPEMTGADVDSAFRELQHRGWLDGDRGEGDGSIVWWTRLRPTVAGLRHLGEWPPEGQEYLPGGWDDRTWGNTDLPRLRDLDASPPAGGFIERPSIGNARDWTRWDASLRLREAGLIDAEHGDGFLSGVRITSAGANVLRPAEDDPLVRARLKLRQGSKADAVTAAIDEVLKPCLRALAIGTGVRVEDLPGKLSDLNNQLKTRGAYGSSGYVSEALRAQVDAWIKVRNVVDHGEGATVNDRRIELLIDGVEQFVSEYR